MRVSSAIALTILFAGMCAVAAAAAVTWYNVSVNYTLGYTPPNLTLVIVPFGVSGVSAASNCSSVLPSFAWRTSVGWVVAWQEGGSYKPGTVVQRYLCNATPYTTTPSVNTSSGILVATCRGINESGSNSVIVDLSAGPYEETIYSYQAEALLVQLNVSVRPILVYPLASINVYIVYDGVYELLGSSTGSAAYTVGGIRAATLRLYLNTSRSIYYGYVEVSWSAEWIAPTRNSTSLSLSGRLVYAIVSGSGWIYASGVNTSFDGQTYVLETPYGLFINGSLVSQGGNTIEIGTGCYGANVTSIAAYQVYSASVTDGVEYRVVGSGVSSPPWSVSASQVFINASISANNTVVARSVSRAAASALVFGSMLLFAYGFARAATMISVASLLGDALAAVVAAESGDSIVAAIAASTLIAKAVIYILYRLLVEGERIW